MEPPHSLTNSSHHESTPYTHNNAISLRGGSFAIPKLSSFCIEKLNLKIAQ